MAHELITVLQQEITPTKNISVEAIRPHILKYGNPAGSLIVNLKDTNGKLIKASTAVTIASISASNYFHGMVRFYLSAPLKSGVTYIIELSASGYSYAASDWIGWCNDFDLRVVDPDFSPAGGTSAPLHLELWERKVVTR